MLGRRIAARRRPPATVQDLEIALLEEWNSMPQSLIDNLIASMANRPEKTCETAGEIARHTTQATGRPISRFTVARQLHGGGLFARRLYGVYL
ncbi:hypothetical protein TNCV_1900831 [Trichonephila clavipes]|nr:hypothetical protein TNCV_1900831 [Trichonephila clavipes]